MADPTAKVDRGRQIYESLIHSVRRDAIVRWQAIVRHANAPPSEYRLTVEGREITSKPISTAFLELLADGDESALSEASAKALLIA